MSVNVELRSQRRLRAAKASCLHCGLPVEDPDTSEFCCVGCEGVYALIGNRGLSRFYDLKQQTTAPPPRYREDSLAWLDQLLRDHDDSLVSLRLDIQGLHCAACVWLLEELFRRREGGLELIINPALGKAELSCDTRTFDLKGFFHDVEKFGYRFGPDVKTDRRGSQGLLVRMGVCAAAAMNTMIFSLSYYFGLSEQDGVLYHLFGKLSLVLAAIAVAVGGSVFIVSAYRALCRGVLHLDFPISTGIILGFAGSLFAYVQGGPEKAYFDTVTIFVTLMLIGRWLQERVLEKNRRILLEDSGVEHLATRRLRDGDLEAIAVHEIEVGDELWIVPGDLVPVSGRVASEGAEVSLDWINGESKTATKTLGDDIPAGAFNGGSKTLVLEALETFSSSKLQSLLQRRDEGSDRANLRIGFWQRVAPIYVLSVLTLATLGFALWMSAGWSRAVEVAVAILVVTCPCAIGLAAPLAEEWIHVALRKRGVFLRTRSALDKIRHVRQIFFDKTGTLTSGDLALDGASCSKLRSLETDARCVLFDMVSRSHHPVSRAIHAALSKSDADLRVREYVQVEEIVGQGLICRFRGHVYELKKPSPSDDDGDQTHFTIDGSIGLSLRCVEVLRPGVSREVRMLKDQKYEVSILSGDGREHTHDVARSLGIAEDHVRAELSPHEKARIIEEKDRHDSLMIGDGLNDRPAFDAAWMTATPAVDRPTLPGLADFYYLGDGIASVRQVAAAAKTLRGLLRSNLTFGVAYNLFAVALCMLGLVGPLMAAVLMPISSVGLVSWTALRLSRRTAQWPSSRS